MTALDNWLDQATRCLSGDSAARVRMEIRDHYESARESAVTNGAAGEEADGYALGSLGNARDVNRQYRRALLTQADVRVLRQGNREMNFVCSRPWLSWVLAGAALASIVAGVAMMLGGKGEAGRILAAAGVVLGPWFAAAHLPIYTPARSRIFRAVKWVAMVGGLTLAFWPDALRQSWLLIPSLWPMAWIEWRNAAIRRKLPVVQWPKQLYL